MAAREIYHKAMREVHENHRTMVDSSAHKDAGHANRIETVKTGLGLLKIGREHFEGKSVLDIGSGTGAYLDAAKELGAKRAVGVDVEPARKDVVAIGGDRLPFRDGEFDVITLGRVFSMARNPLALAQEVKRVLRPGGLVIVEDIFDLPFSTIVLRRLVQEKEITSQEAKKIMMDIQLPVVREKDGVQLSKIDPAYISKLFVEAGVECEASGVQLPALKGFKPSFFMALRHLS